MRWHADGGVQAPATVLTFFEQLVRMDHSDTAKAALSKAQAAIAPQGLRAVSQNPLTHCLPGLRGAPAKTPPPQRTAVMRHVCRVSRAGRVLPTYPSVSELQPPASGDLMITDFVDAAVALVSPSQ